MTGEGSPSRAVSCRIAKKYVTVRPSVCPTASMRTATNGRAHKAGPGRNMEHPRCDWPRWGSGSSDVGSRACGVRLPRPLLSLGPCSPWTLRPVGCQGRLARHLRAERTRKGSSASPAVSLGRYGWMGEAAQGRGR